MSLNLPDDWGVRKTWSQLNEDTTVQEKISVSDIRYIPLGSIQSIILGELQGNPLPLETLISHAVAVYTEYHGASNKPMTRREAEYVLNELINKRLVYRTYRLYSLTNKGLRLLSKRDRELDGV